jgi:predicted metal-dependent hydrolase
MRMSELVVRRLLIDLEAQIPRHWNGGDAFRTAFFDALSMSFPVGEQFFIDSVRAGLRALPEAQRALFEAEVRGFVGQEATHRRIHALYNSQLARQGLVNRWESRALKRIRALDGLDLRTHLGVTAATEHFTAIFAEHLLSHEALLAGAEPRLATLWRWHSAEETEHRSTAFDLYRALGGDEYWRLRIYRIVTLNFIVDALRQTLLNLWRDGSWWRLSTWVGGARLLFGHDGLVRHLREPWRRYLAQDFHPSQQDDALARRWLADNVQMWRPV